MPLSLDPHTISFGGQAWRTKHDGRDIFFKGRYLDLGMQLSRQVAKHQFTNGHQGFVHLVLGSIILGIPCSNTPSKIEIQPGTLIQQFGNTVASNDNTIPFLESRTIIEGRTIFFFSIVLTHSIPIYIVLTHSILIYHANHFYTFIHHIPFPIYYTTEPDRPISLAGQSILFPYIIQWKVRQQKTS